MLVFTDTSDLSQIQRPSAVAIGVFDGLHRGHEVVLATLLDNAQGCATTVLTFDPHPANVLSPDRDFKLLQTVDQRIEQLAKQDLDQVRVVTFSEERAQQSPEDFIKEVLVEQLGAEVVVVGEDFCFGRNRSGTVQTLRDAGERWGFTVLACSSYGEGVEGRFSSTMARKFLKEGNVEGCQTVLGRCWQIRGLVVEGDKRGRELGFPTANLLIDAHQVVPGDGVYAGATRIDGEWLPSAISVGTRPQFYENGAVLVEDHLTDFDGDLYGQYLDVAFIERLRGQAKYDSLEALIAQITTDVQQSRRIFKDFAPFGETLLG
jgi:riboflavin kinase / FMN adenylyltransferase